MRLIDADALFAALNKKRLVYHAEIDTTILNMPTIDPKPKWIPVAERLPEDDAMMIVTCRTKKGVLSVNRAYYSNGCWHGSGSMSGVIAWMPLPEPYDPEDIEKEDEA